MPKCVLKPKTFQALQWFSGVKHPFLQEQPARDDGFIGPQGILTISWRRMEIVNEGDWILTDEDGRITIMTNDGFAQDYMIVE